MINTMDYWASKHPDKRLHLSEDPRQSVSFVILEGNTQTAGRSAYVKTFTQERRAEATEFHHWDESHISLRMDTNLYDPYSFDPGWWMKRFMKPGELLRCATNCSTWYKLSDCSIIRSHRAPFTNKLLGRTLHYNAGGDLGVLNIIRLHYHWGAHSRQEVFYYSNEWGFFQWDWLEPDGTLVMRKCFNRVTTNPVQPPANPCYLRVNK